MVAEGTFKLQNGNFGMVNHNYYQQTEYNILFKELWEKLRKKKIVSKTLLDIENSEFFKYSPYKSLNEDQYASVLKVLESLSSLDECMIFLMGSAGTGKTILATYLLKLLTSKVSEIDLDEYNEDEVSEINYLRSFKHKHPAPKVAIVIAMTSLRKSLQNVFSEIPGLNRDMVISPSEAVNYDGIFDLLIVDEAHRLRQYKNIGWMGEFKKKNNSLGLNDNGTELDWIIAKSKNQIFFYDESQSVRPSDIDLIKFKELIEQPDTIKLELSSQMRVKGGNNYIEFVDQLLNVNLDNDYFYQNQEYDLCLYDSFSDLRKQLIKKEAQFGLCRMVAGYSWEWVSKKQTDNKIYDIEIEGLSFNWNSTDKDWVNSPNAFNEIGCIHTTQGYDLNYAAVIFGKEIDYDPILNCIIIEPNLYFDANGKKGINDLSSLKQYIINIYKTLMYRGIRGTYVYAYNPNLRDYLKKHMVTFSSSKIPK
jgi:DUF2075 family protein